MPTESDGVVAFLGGSGLCQDPHGDFRMTHPYGDYFVLEVHFHIMEEAHRRRTRSAVFLQGSFEHLQGQDHRNRNVNMSFVHNVEFETFDALETFMRDVQGVLKGKEASSLPTFVVQRCLDISRLLAA